MYIPMREMGDMYIVIDMGRETEEEQKRNRRGTEDEQDRKGTEENSRNRGGIHRDFRVAVGRETGHDVVELLVSVQEYPPDQAASWRRPPRRA